jgi:anti-sigma factor RsiW
MEHYEAVQSLAVEKYLLDEFDSGEREAFEDHFFSCHECAEELQATAALLDRGKELFAHEPLSYVERVPEPEKTPAGANRRPAPPDPHGWFGWLRPAIAAPAMALLLLVVAVQNLYQLPGLERSLSALNAPAVLPSATGRSGVAREWWWRNRERISR